MVLIYRYLSKDNTVCAGHGAAAFFAAVAISRRLLGREKHASQRQTVCGGKHSNDGRLPLA